MRNSSNVKNSKDEMKRNLNQTIAKTDVGHQNINKGVKKIDHNILDSDDIGKLIYVVTRT